MERLYVTGGEPFLRKDIFDLARHVTGDLGCELIVLTNATVFAGAVRKGLESLDRSLVKMQVSIDGARPETNDAVRGEGTFAEGARRREAPRGPRFRGVAHDGPDAREPRRAAADPGPREERRRAEPAPDVEPQAGPGAGERERLLPREPRARPGRLRGRRGGGARGDLARQPRGGQAARERRPGREVRLRKRRLGLRLRLRRRQGLPDGRARGRAGAPLRRRHSAGPRRRPRDLAGREAAAGSDARAEALDDGRPVPLLHRRRRPRARLVLHGRLPRRRPLLPDRRRADEARHDRPRGGEARPPEPPLRLRRAARPPRDGAGGDRLRHRRRQRWPNSRS